MKSDKQAPEKSLQGQYLQYIEFLILWPAHDYSGDPHYIALTEWVEALEIQVIYRKNPAVELRRKQ